MSADNSMDPDDKKTRKTYAIISLNTGTERLEYKRFVCLTSFRSDTMIINSSAASALICGICGSKRNQPGRLFLLLVLQYIGWAENHAATIASQRARVAFIWSGRNQAAATLRTAVVYGQVYVHGFAETIHEMSSHRLFSARLTGCFDVSLNHQTMGV